MRNDDFFDDDEGLDDSEAFDSTLYSVATSQMHALYTLRANQCTDIADGGFFRLIEALLHPFEEFLPPDEFKELWDYLFMIQCEWRKETDPSVNRQQCEAEVRQHLRGPQKSNPNPHKASGKQQKKGRE